MKYDMLSQKTVERVWKVNPTVQLLDAEFTDEDTGVPETVQIPTEIDAMFKARKLLKNFMHTIRNARKVGIEVDIIESQPNN